MERTCGHLDMMASDVRPTGAVCETGKRTGETWYNALRVCQTCGHVGCCDSSPGKHAREHYERTGHPVTKPFRDPEAWTWCYADETYVDPPRS